MTAKKRVGEGCTPDLGNVAKGLFAVAEAIDRLSNNVAATTPILDDGSATELLRALRREVERFSSVPERDKSFAIDKLKMEAVWCEDGISF